MSRIFLNSGTLIVISYLIVVSSNPPWSLINRRKYKLLSIVSIFWRHSSSQLKMQTETAFQAFLGTRACEFLQVPLTSLFLKTLITKEDISLQKHRHTVQLLRWARVPLFLAFYIKFGSDKSLTPSLPRTSPQSQFENFSR